VTKIDKPFWLPELRLKGEVTGTLDPATAQKPQKLDSGQGAAKTLMMATGTRQA
jgi:hypothetical protein